MEIYTVDDQFFRNHTIDVFDSALWTERYYGDGDFELLVPKSTDMLDILTKGTILMCKGSDEPMILETRDIQNGVLKTTGITLTKWLNNRIIRTSADHSVKDWHLTGEHPGSALGRIVLSMCMDSEYTNGTIPIGIPSAQTELFVVPGLYLGAYDISDPVTEFSVPFGPVYDALRTIAETYEIGMNITFAGAYEDYFMIQFNTYKGEDRTSSQSVNPVIRFSEEMDSFTSIHDLESITDHRNYVFTFAPTADPALITAAGFATSMTTPEAGFNLRVTEEFVDSLPDGIDSTGLINLLNQQATTQTKNRKPVQLVDGQIVQVEGVEYGTNFFMGDIVEVEGNTGVLQKARITEYIRSKDSAGERAYPTLSMID